MAETESNYDSADQAAQNLRMGERRSTFRPARASPWYPVFVLVPILALCAFILSLMATAGLLTSIIGIFFIIVCVALVVLPAAGMWISSKDARSGQELHIFDGGVVLRGAKGQIVPYRWEDTRVLVSVVRREPVYTYSYALLKPAARPVIMGQNVALLSVLSNTTGEENFGDVVRAPLFERMDVWGKLIEEGITRTHLPRTLEELAAGRAVQFGPATVTSHALTIDRTDIPWNEISALTIDQGFLRVKKAGKFFKSSLQVSYVPNFLVLAAVIHQFSGASLV